MPTNRIDRLGAALIAAFLLVYAACFLVRAGFAVTYPFPTIYGEGAVTATARALNAAVPIYRNPAAAPWLSANYGPLFYLPISAAPEGFEFVVGRAVSVLATIAIAAGLVWLATPRREPLWRGLICGGLWLALGPVYAWSAVAKPDLLALAFAFWGLALARRVPVVAGALLAAAVMTKPTALVAIAALAIAIGTDRLAQRLVANQIKAVATAVAGLAGATILLQASSDGWFLTRVLWLNGLTWSGEQGIQALVNFARLDAPLLVLALATTVWRIRCRRVAVWDIYLILTLFVLAPSVAKVGAYINYYLDPLLAAVACLAWTARRLGRGRRRESRSTEKPSDLLPRWRIAGGLVAAQLVLAAHLPGVAEPIATPGPADRRRAAEVITAIRALPDPWLAEDAGWLVAAGRPVRLDDPFFFTQLAAAGEWDPGPLIDSIERREFSAVLLDFDPGAASIGFHAERFSPAILTALRRAYPRVEPLGAHWRLQPAE